MKKKKPSIKAQLASTLHHNKVLTETIERVKAQEKERADQNARLRADLVRMAEVEQVIKRTISSELKKPAFAKAESVPVDAKADPVNHPGHYTSHPSSIECIQVTEHMNFCIGNAVKYLWRADFKGKALEDLEKAKWYIERELKRRKNES